MILIIAYGNTLREDDGAGLVLAEKLESLLRRFAIDVHRVEVQQLLPELAAEIAGHQPDGVVFVDTRVAIAYDEAVSVQPVPVDSNASPSLGHQLTPATVLTYTGALFDAVEQPAWLVTVPGWQFGFGEDLSTNSEKAIFHALNDSKSQLQQLVDAVRQLSTNRHNGVP